jgi:hypothetical protein
VVLKGRHFDPSGQVAGFGAQVGAVFPGDTDLFAGGNGGFAEKPTLVPARGKVDGATRVNQVGAKVGSVVRSAAAGLRSCRGRGSEFTFVGPDDPPAERVADLGALAGVVEQFHHMAGSMGDGAGDDAVVQAL